MQICKKYNLFIGNTGDFRGFVPEKNLQEIENFKLLAEDVIEVRYKEWYNEPIRDGQGQIISDRDNMALTKKAYTWEREWKFTPDIIAPLDQFTEMPHRVIDGYKLRSSNRQVAPDPIVLQRVERGYLIVTAWGDEAADPIVVNSRNN